MPNSQPRTRATDRLGERIRRWVRDVTLVLAAFLSLYAAVEAKVLVDDVQSSRATTRSVLCAANAAVIDAGRAIITGGAPKPGERETAFELNLRKLGYPPPPVRRAQAAKAARLYAQKIAETIETQTHVKGIVNADGSLNCRKLEELATHPGSRPRP